MLALLPHVARGCHLEYLRAGVVPTAACFLPPLDVILILPHQVRKGVRVTVSELIELVDQCPKAVATPFPLAIEQSRVAEDNHDLVWCQALI